MTKTFADMTKKERANCQGMWCEDDEGNLCIYKINPHVPEHLAACIYPYRVGSFLTLNSRLTPRPDLPRAWNANGTPPAGEWEYAEVPGLGESTQRWVGEWTYE